MMSGLWKKLELYKAQKYEVQDRSTRKNIEEYRGSDEVQKGKGNQLAHAYDTWLDELADDPEVKQASKDVARRASRKLNPSTVRLTKLALPNLTKRTTPDVAKDKKERLATRDESFTAMTLTFKRRPRRLPTLSKNQEHDLEKEFSSSEQQEGKEKQGRQRFTLESKEANFVKNAYDLDTKLVPCLGFYKWMNIPSTEIKMPATLVIEGEDMPILWIHPTQKNNSSWKISVFTSRSQLKLHEREILKSLCHVYYDANLSKGTNILAVRKTRAVNHSVQSNEVHFLDSLLTLKAEWQGILDAKDTPHVVLQRYIPPRGAAAWIVRAVWTRRAIYAYVITDSKNPFYTNTAPLHETSCIVKSTAAHSWSQPKALVDTLVRALEERHGLSFRELAADFVQDSQAEWWLLQVKAFKCNSVAWKNSNLSQPAPSSALRSTSRSEGSSSMDWPNESTASTAACTGRYCKKSIPNAAIADSHETGNISYKDMLLAHFTEMYCLEESSVSLDEPQFNIALQVHLNNLSKKDKVQFYNRKTLCGNCHAEYARLGRLRNQLMSTNTERLSRRNLRELFDMGSTSLRVDDSEWLPAKDTIDHVDEESQPLDESFTELKVETKASGVNEDDAFLKHLEGLENDCNRNESVLAPVDETTKLTLPNQLEQEHKPAIFEEEDDLTRLNEKRIERVLELERNIKTTQESLATPLTPSPVDGNSPQSIHYDDLLHRNIPHHFDAVLKLNTVKAIWETAQPAKLELKANQEDSMQSNALVRWHETTREEAKLGFHSFLPLHVIRIEESHRIFYDETYKQEVLSEAMEYLQLMHRIQFEIPFSSSLLSESKNSSPDLALHTLYMDMKDGYQGSLDKSNPVITKDDVQSTTIMLITP